MPATNTHSIGAYLRIASIAIAGYDFLITTPASYRIYKYQYRSGKISSSGVLYFLLQLVSITVLTVSNVGFFASNFTLESCGRFYVLAPLFKTLQGAVSQAILGMRTWNLSRRQRSWGYFILVLYIVAVSIEAVTTLYGRGPVLDKEFHNCLPSSRTNSFVGSFTYYGASMGYDIVSTIIIVYFLMKFKHVTQSRIMSDLVKMMLLDGVGYFIALTAINVVNFVLYRSGTGAELQTAAASLGYCFLWILSQKLLIHLHDASSEHRVASLNAEGVYTTTHNIDSARGITEALRSQFESKSGRSRVQFDLLSSLSPTTRLDTISVRDRTTATSTNHQRQYAYNGNGNGHANGMSHRYTHDREHDGNGRNAWDDRYGMEEEGSTTGEDIVELRRPDHSVEVRVEKTYKLSRNPMAYQMEDYTRDVGGGSGRATQRSLGRDRAGSMTTKSEVLPLPRSSFTRSRRDS